MVSKASFEVKFFGFLFNSDFRITFFTVLIEDAELSGFGAIAWNEIKRSEGTSWEQRVKKHLGIKRLSGQITSTDAENE